MLLTRLDRLNPTESVFVEPDDWTKSFGKFSQDFEGSVGGNHTSSVESVDTAEINLTTLFSLAFLLSLISIQR